MTVSTRSLAVVGAFGILVIGAVFSWFWRVREHGFSARHEPTTMEITVVRAMRNLAIPSDLRDANNPVTRSPEMMASALAHFADHCASCHGNDGRGQTSIGQNFFPKVPDMTLDHTQSMTDGQIFAIIKNGVRLTGMPAWGEETPEGDRESWELVHFIRHLPEITAEELVEMEAMNPSLSQADIDAIVEEEMFLAGMIDEVSSTPSGHH